MSLSCVWIDANSPYGPLGEMLGPGLVLDFCVLSPGVLVETVLRVVSPEAIFSNRTHR
jgi:hypothetical protein